MQQVTIQLKLFHALRRYLPAEASEGKVTLRVPEGTTLQEVLSAFGIPDAEPKIVVINGQSQGVCTMIRTNPALRDGDVVAVFPPVAGG